MDGGPQNAGAMTSRDTISRATSENVADEVLRVLDEAGFAWVPKIATLQVANAAAVSTPKTLRLPTLMALAVSGRMRQQLGKNDAAE